MDSVVIIKEATLAASYKAVFTTYKSIRYFCGVYNSGSEHVNIFPFIGIISMILVIELE
jgi:hypothetical protein